MAANGYTKKVIGWWFFAYLLSLPFLDAWRLPLVIGKVQAAELVFLIGLIIIGKQFIIDWKPNALDTALALVPGALFVALIINPALTAILEVIGLIYLLGVYRLSFLVGQYYSSDQIGRWLVPYSWILVVISGLSFILCISGYDSKGYLSEWKWIPFLDYMPRISGAAASNNLWASLIAFSGFVHWVSFRKRLRSSNLKYLLLALAISYIFTLSKSAVLVLGALLLWEGLQRPTFQFLYPSGIGLFAVFVIVTHFIIVPKQIDNEKISYLPPGKCVEIGNVKLCPTTYSLLKFKSVQAVLESNGLGVGGGRFHKWLEQQQEEGNYPASVPAYDPHSTYFGIAAEAGVLGLLALIFMIFSLSVKINESSATDIVSVGLSLYILTVALDAIAMDVLNFRMLWVAIGLWAGINTRSLNKSPSSPTPPQTPPSAPPR